mmetsp:Transcript_25632/g.82763  ORF Transcript_25632/g.82763 Transcript_25632/m.82763 type:complete len:260 (+) Transcript_25632:305-1084(+)
MAKVLPLRSANSGILPTIAGSSKSIAVSKSDSWKSTVARAPGPIEALSRWSSANAVALRTTLRRCWLALATWLLAASPDGALLPREAGAWARAEAAVPRRPRPLPGLLGRLLLAALAPTLRRPRPRSSTSSSRYPSSCSPSSSDSGAATPTEARNRFAAGAAASATGAALGLRAAAGATGAALGLRKTATCEAAADEEAEAPPPLLAAGLFLTGGGDGDGDSGANAAAESCRVIRFLGGMGGARPAPQSTSKPLRCGPP